MQCSMYGRCRLCYASFCLLRWQVSSFFSKVFIHLGWFYTLLPKSCQYCLKKGRYTVCFSALCSSAIYFPLRTIKVKFPANWVFLWLYCSYTKFHIFKFYIFLYLYTTTLGALWRHIFDFLPKILAKNRISTFRGVLTFSCKSTKMCKIKKIWNFLFLQ